MEETRSYCQCTLPPTRIVPLKTLVHWTCAAVDRRYGVVTRCTLVAKYVVCLRSTEEPLCEFHVRLRVQHRMCLYCNVFCTQCSQKPVGTGFIACENDAEEHWTHEDCMKHNRNRCSHCSLRRAERFHRKTVLKLDYCSLPFKICSESSANCNVNMLSLCTSEELEMVSSIYEMHVLKADYHQLSVSCCCKSRGCSCVLNALNFALFEVQKTSECLNGIITEIFQHCCFPALLILLECDKLPRCNTYLSLAVKQNLPVFARLLWLYKEDKSEDLTLLFYALSAKHWEVALLFLFYEFKEYYCGICVLHKAFCQLGLEAVSFLLENGVSLYEVDDKGQCILHLFAKAKITKNDEPIIKSIINKIPSGNSFINLPDSNGQKPLEIALEKKNWILVECLLMKEATLANISELNYIPERILWLVDFYRKSVERKKFRLRESLICRDLSRGKESVCIAVENSVFDDAVIDAEEFTYVSILNRPIFFTEQCDLSLVCQCTGLCSDNCFCTSRCPYTNDGCLSDEYIQLALNGNAGIIVECNQTCFCPSNCRSKVAQKGIKVRLQVYRTVKYGWAVKAVEKISKGQFICEYTGNAIEPAELDDNCDDSYIFEVQEGFYIDAKSCGNVSRFINHSCDANLVMAHAVWDIYTQHTPHICFYARNEINEGDELTLDYGKVWWKAKAGTIVCQCNSEVCRYNSVEKFDMNFL